MSKAVVTVDEAYHVVRIGGGVVRTMTHTELKFLLVIGRHPGRVFSREELLDQVWQKPDDLDTRCVDQFVARIRKKLGRMGPKCVQTVPMAGYRAVGMRVILKEPVKAVRR